MPCGLEGNRGPGGVPPVPELREVLALLFADLPDRCHQEVDDEADEHQLSIIAHMPRPRQPTVTAAE